MDANTFATFAIGGLVIFFVVYDHTVRLVRRYLPAVAASPAALAPETIEAATDDRPIALRPWIDYVNAQPNQVPHLAIIGGSGSGKTTTATAILADRTGQIIILTGKDGDP